MHLAIKSALIALLLALPAWAGDEDLAPNADVDSIMDPLAYDNDCGTQCTGTDCYLEVDEDPDGAEDDQQVTASSPAVVAIFGFPTPASPPGFEADAQRVHLIASVCRADDCTEDDAGYNPSFYLYLYCGEVLRSTIASSIFVDVADTSFAYDFTLHGDCASDGSDVEVGFGMAQIGLPGNENARRTCLENIEWEVTWGTSTGRQGYIVQ